MPNIWGNWNMKFAEAILYDAQQWGIEIMLYQFPTMGNWISINSPLWEIENFRCNIGIFNPSPRLKRDWSNSPIVTRGKPLVIFLLVKGSGHFLTASIFETLYSLNHAQFLTTRHFPKYSNFLWLCCILVKKAM